jgi:succinyl-CoA synthetase beta subunit
LSSFFFSFSLILISDCPFQLIIACSKGGTSIEDLAEKYPDMIIKVKFPNIILGSLYLYGSVVFHIYMILLQIVLPMLKFNLLECQVPIDVFKGITDEDAAKVVDGLALKAADRQSSIEQIKKLYELFCKCDCTLLEVCSEKWSSF